MSAPEVETAGMAGMAGKSSGVDLETEPEPGSAALDGLSSSSTAAFLRKPDVLAALQRRLQAQFLKALPFSVQRRIRCLKNLQRQATCLEAKFYEEVHLLEMKYHNLYAAHYDKRSKIVTGKYEPTEDECFFLEKRDADEGETEGEDRTEEGQQEEVKKEEDKNEEEEDVKGVPEFWLTVFKNIQMWNVSDMVQEHDEPILKHLEDIKVIYHAVDPMGFSLEFYFSPNEYFSNTLLTKVYEMRCEPDSEDPFSFEGPDIYKCKGCAIDWNKGMNVTVKLVKKQVNLDGKDPVVTITAEPSDSFFNFFSPPHTPKDPSEDIDEETQFLLTSDFAIGHYIRERIVPRAVLYFTGDALISEEYERNIKGEELRDRDEYKSEYSIDNIYPGEIQSDTSIKKYST